MSSDPLVPKDPNLEPLPPKPLEPLDPSVNDPVLDTKDTKPVKPRDEASSPWDSGRVGKVIVDPAPHRLPPAILEGTAPENPARASPSP